MALETFRYDAAEFLTDDATISAYLNVSLEEEDPSYFIRALGAVARARRRMDYLAQELGMPVDVLDRSLREGKVGFDAVLVIARSLGFPLSARLAVEKLREEASVA